MKFMLKSTRVDTTVKLNRTYGLTKIFIINTYTYSDRGPKLVPYELREDPKNNTLYKLEDGSIVHNDKLRDKLCNANMMSLLEFKRIPRQDDKDTILTYFERANQNSFFIIEVGRHIEFYYRIHTPALKEFGDDPVELSSHIKRKLIQKLNIRLDVNYYYDRVDVYKDFLVMYIKDTFNTERSFSAIYTAKGREGILRKFESEMKSDIFKTIKEYGKFLNQRYGKRV